MKTLLNTKVKTLCDSTWRINQLNGVLKCGIDKFWICSEDKLLGKGQPDLA